ncbi:hypothetical protein IGI04_002135 [Brassica rapa subsp. trilocularis]|uniref:Uncharacterized protein n=1 Tax=Brassica rapa subsp. trilocularis TaxID=1813537 RepID=A0ABQ7NUR5_BRACM|nr:hypothetical protein IGI04_002135 [Brassica rapa subsp. trilocularis]
MSIDIETSISTNGERRGDLTPAARLQSVTNTLGRESARMNLSHSLTTSRTHTKPRRARHAYNEWLKFPPDLRLLRAPATMLRRNTVQRPGGPQPHQPEDTLPPFPPMPDMSTRPEGDFQHVVANALTAIWARVSRCRYSSRRSVRAS